MRLPHPNASSETLIAYAEHVEDACEAWAEIPLLTEAQRGVVKQVGAEVTAANDTLQARFAEREKAERKLRKCTTRYGVCDTVLDNKVMVFKDAVLNGPALRSLAHPYFVAIFRDQNAGDITKANTYEEPDIVRRLIRRADDQPDFPGKKVARDELAERVDVSLKERDLMDEAEEAVNKAVDAELAARLHVREAMEVSYGKLRAAFPGRRDFVESFFPKQSRPRKPSAGEQSGDGSEASETPEK